VTEGTGDGRAAFVVRIWRRRAAAGESWVGRVTRISSNTSRSFSGIEELVVLVRDEMQSASDDAGGSSG
jgi:hypothetical protein